MTESSENLRTKITLHVKPKEIDKEVDKDDDIFAYADKREGVTWTPEEVVILKEGISKYGKGNWNQILKYIRDDVNPLRRPKDLSDKVRILEKQTTYLRRVKRDHWEVDNNNEPICKMGEKVIYRAKLPYEAAYKCAWTKNYTTGEKKIIKICYEEGGRLWFHVYAAKFNKTNDRRNRIKIRKIAGQSPYRNDNM